MVLFLDTCPFLYGQVKDTKSIREAVLTTAGHCIKTQADVERFFCALAACPFTSHLAEMLEDPEQPSTKTFRFYLWTRGVQHENKWKIVNHAMLVFGQSLVKKPYRNRKWCDINNIERADAMYQPNTIQGMHKRLNPIFRRNGITYSLHSDFEGKGGFQAFWQNRLSKAMVLRPDLGSLPLRAKFDTDSDRKIREEANPPFQPYDNYDDCLQLIVHYILESFTLRGRQEVRN